MIEIVRPDQWQNFVTRRTLIMAAKPLRPSLTE